MTGSQKMILGIVINVISICPFLGGILLSFTVAGAIIGVPVACCIGLPLTIIGTVLFWEGRVQMSQEAIVRGIQKGMANARAPSRSEIRSLPMIQPPVSTIPSAGKVCPKCSTPNPSEYAFCGDCVTPLNHTRPAPLIEPPVSVVPSVKKICPKCGTPNPSEYALCGDCGTPLNNKSGTP